MSYTQFANKVFTNILESIPPPPITDQVTYGDGIVTSVAEFIGLVGEVVRNSKDQYAIADTNALIPSEYYPADLLWRINNSQEQITDSTKKDLTIVTYTADERPGSKGTFNPLGNDGLRTIKPRLLDTYPDPKYTGYTVARIGKEVEATITFNVWGFDDKGIRERSLLLRKIIQDNTWYLKYKGLREIVWIGAKETDVWDKLNIVRFKKEQYKIVFMETQLLHEKNIEQVAVNIEIDLTVS